MKREPKQPIIDTGDFLQTGEDPVLSAEDMSGEDPVLSAEDMSAANPEETTEPEKTPEKEESSSSPSDDLPKDPSESRKRRPGARARKKKVIDRGLSAVMAAVFFVIMLAVSILLLAVPRSSTSQVERRSLASWPSFSVQDYFAGTYTSAISEYYDDTVPARDTLKNIGSNLKALFGITSEGSAEVIGTIHKAQDVSSESQEVLTAETQTTVSDITEQETPEITSKDYHIENQDAIDENGYLIVLQDGHWRAFSLFTGVDSSLYAETVNYIRQMIDPSVNIYVMPAPLAVQFYCPANYLDYVVDLKISFRELSSRLVSGITAVDAIDVLDEHNMEDIYLRTDHHWAHLAAYYAAGEFASAAGVPYAGLDTYEKNVREGYVGTMYGLTGSANLLNDPEDFVYYVPTNSYIADYYDEEMTFLFRKGLFFNNELNDSYGVALGEDDIIIHVKTDVQNGRKLLVIKDSYGNPTVPFLTSSFEEIYVVDQRYFDFNLLDMINKTQVTDILFVHDYFSLAGAESELMEYITYSNLDTEFPDFVTDMEVPEEGNPDINGSDVIFASEILGYDPAESYGEYDEESEYEESDGDWDEEWYEDDYEEEW